MASGLRFVGLVGRFNDEMKRVTFHFLIELGVVRACQEEAEASDARSRAMVAEAELIVLAVRKEQEVALARANGLTARLQAAEAERAKAEEATKASAEASVAHLGQLQETRAQRDGKCPPLFLSLVSTFVSPL